MKVKLNVKKTASHEQPFADFIVLLHPKTMKKLNIKTENYIKITKSFPFKKKEKTIEVRAAVWPSDSEYIVKYEEEEEKEDKEDEIIGEEDIGIDQTYREALGLKIDEKITITTTLDKVGFWEKVLNKWNFQKSVVRAQSNADYMERKTPYACICEEVVKSIGANYGDENEVEAKGETIKVKCQPLSKLMQDFHDMVMLSPDNDEMKKYKERLTEKYFADPNDYCFGSSFFDRKGDMIHPIFVDGVTNRRLKIGKLDILKIRRSFSWEMQKKLQSLGTISLLGLSVTVPFLAHNPSNPWIWGWMIGLGVWGGLSVLVAPRFKN